MDATKKNIAVVEDNPDTRLLLKALLDATFDVMEFDNGPDALLAFKSRVPDLVVLDISLPGMNGIEILREIRSDVEIGGVPVLALTAHAMAGDREDLLEAGFDEYLTKPIVDLEAFTSILTHHLDKKAA